MKLQRKFWGYLETYHGSYIQLIDNNDVIWESGWYENYTEEYEELREEVVKELDNRRLKYDLSGNNLDEWTIL